MASTSQKKNIKWVEVRIHSSNFFLAVNHLAAAVNPLPPLFSWILCDYHFAVGSSPR